MKILYVYRHSDLGYSIRKVFHPIEEEMKNYADVDSIYLPIPNYSLKGLWENIRYVQKHCKSKKYDIIHITGTEHYLIPFLYGNKVVVTVHDLGRFFKLKGFQRWRYWIMQVAVLKFANIITCISLKTFNDIIKNVSISKDRMIVIPNAVDNEFTFYHKEFNYIKPTLLHIGTRPNKNLERSIIAMKDLNCKLRIVGKVSDSMVELLKNNRIEYNVVYNLSNDEIIQEYREADIINFPSLSEGFGMPIIEGQATGRVVVTSNMSPMKEVAGNGAVLVDPLSIESIRDAYMKIINDKVLRLKIIEKGKVNATRYKVETIAEQYINLYKMIETL